MKKKMILFLVLVLLFLVLQTIGLQGEEKERITILAFVSGNRYLGYTEINKLNYTEGLMDMLFCQTYVFNPELYSNLEETTKDMTAGQIKAIFYRYLEEHPEEWHNGAASMFHSAITEIVGVGRD
ncbi:hypothetical protein ES695_00630 [Candidatus Atribacteria bacterium 1244-E10-H5-B2]|nr:MAG: hypothetical protein ES695_00630 [Candidatus Atribacteria bacterium 1244-E10-H5-B2]